MSEVRKIQISQDMVNDYARISGDDNPIHQDPSFARDEGFDTTIVHGMFVLSLMGEYFSVSSKFDTQSKLLLNARFKKPVYVDEEITFFIENKKKIIAKNSTNEICVEVVVPNV